jgi:hypothetical protein
MNAPVLAGSNVHLNFPALTQQTALAIATKTSIEAKKNFELGRRGCIATPVVGVCKTRRQPPQARRWRIRFRYYSTSSVGLPRIIPLEGEGRKSLPQLTLHAESFANRGPNAGNAATDVNDADCRAPRSLVPG